jgi:hypothetical protein
VSASYALAKAEVHREVKRVACEVVRDLTTYDAGATPGQIARCVTSDPVRQARLRKSARPLCRSGWWSRGQVVYPQMGGLAGGRASVMVVVRREAGREADPEVVETRTLDVRLIRAGGAWVFDALASAGGTAIERPAGLSACARAVLDDPRIELPDSARWDIYRGDISPSLLRLMTDMADQGPYAVVVLRTGHPRYVFGTTRVSQHTVGQAVDLYRVERSLVVERTASGAPCALARWLCGRDDLGQLGSPWALADAGGRAFSDTVHQDHLHIAVRQ